MNAIIKCGGRRRPSQIEQKMEEIWLKTRTVDPESVGDRSWNIAYITHNSDGSLAYCEVEMPIGIKFTYWPFQYEKEELEVGKMYIYPEEPDEEIYGYFSATIESSQPMLN